MKNLENYGVKMLDSNEIKRTEGGWAVQVLQGIAYLASLTVAANEACDQCITKKIASGDSSLDGSRPFE